MGGDDDDDNDRQSGYGTNQRIRIKRAMNSHEVITKEYFETAEEHRTPVISFSLHRFVICS